MYISCHKDGCNEVRQRVYRPRSHRPDADCIAVDFCCKGHQYSVCPRMTCCHLRVDKAKKYQPWITDINKREQWIHLCESCLFENSVIMVCKTCFDNAGKKAGLKDLCKSCLCKKTEMSSLSTCYHTTAGASASTVEHWVFHTQFSKPFKQCSLVSVDNNRVRVRQLFNSKVHSFYMRVLFSGLVCK